VPSSVPKSATSCSGRKSSVLVTSNVLSRLLRRS
jgi:hypothetical protein